MNEAIPKIGFENISRYLSSASQVVKETIGTLDNIGVPWAFFAGVAAAVYGVKRGIKDLDIIFPLQSAELISRAFPNFDRAPKRGSEYSLSKDNLELVPGYLAYYSFNNEYRFEFDKEMMARRRSLVWNGITLYFLSPEDTIVLKAILQRESNGSEFDITDIATILATVKIIDTEYLRDRALRSNALLRLERVLELLGTDETPENTTTT